MYKRMLAMFTMLAGLIAITGDAHAYLDPGTGSAILQGILGAVAAIAITLKLYWHRLLRFLGLRKASGSGNVPGEAGEHEEAAAPRER